MEWAVQPSIADTVDRDGDLDNAVRWGCQILRPAFLQPGDFGAQTLDFDQGNFLTS